MKRHRVDPLSLLFGALFVSVGMVFLAGSSIGEAPRSIWPAVAVIVGATLATWAISSSLRRRPPVEEAPEEETSEETSEVT